MKERRCKRGRARGSQFAVTHVKAALVSFCSRGQGHAMSSERAKKYSPGRPYVLYISPVGGENPTWPAPNEHKANPRDPAGTDARTRRQICGGCGLPHARQEQGAFKGAAPFSAWMT